MNAIQVFFVSSFFVLWGSALVGSFLRRRPRKVDANLSENLGIIIPGTLTLLGLIVGFSFSMALDRYDQRKNYKEAEANAMGTEYLRADLLPAADALKVRPLLRNYLDQRILFYVTGDEEQIRQINARTARLQSELWSAVLAPASAKPTPVVALVV
jgi:hypothetical protein